MPVSVSSGKGTARITIVQGDTSPPLRAKLVGANGLPQSLLGAQVYLTIRPQSGSGAPMVDDQLITIENAAQGIVRYDWEVGDTANVCQCVARFRVVFGDGRQQSFPNGWTFGVRIIPAL